MTSQWYEELRNAHRPEQVRVLLIGESPPDAADRDRRFFYSPTLDQRDYLYRGVAEALYGELPAFDLTEKTANLRRMQRDGFWLIDLSDEPINRLTGKARNQARLDAIPGLVQRATEAAPSVGAIVCMAPLFNLLKRPLELVDISVLHSTALKFPMNYFKAEFIDGLRHAIADA